MREAEREVAASRLEFAERRVRAVDQLDAIEEEQNARDDLAPS